MTGTDKPVKRVTRREYNVLFPSDRKRRAIVVEIKAGDILEFREHGRRGRWQLAIDTAFRYAVRLKAFADAGDRGRQKRSRR